MMLVVGGRGWRWWKIAVVRAVVIGDGWCDAWWFDIGITYGGCQNGCASWLLVGGHLYVFIIILCILPIFYIFFIKFYAFIVFLNSFYVTFFIKYLLFYVLYY